MGNIHETIDRFGSLTPRVKLIVGAGIALIVIALFAGVFYWGVRSGDGWAESRYTRERDENLKKIQKFEGNEKQLAAENAMLKKQNEATAEILKANDAKLTGDATKFVDLLTERTKRNEAIDLDNDFDTQLCALCDEGKRSGFAPFSFCGRCKAVP